MSVLKHHFFLYQVSHQLHIRSSLAKECMALRVKAYEVLKVTTLLLFKRNCTVHQVLKARTWSSQLNFSAFYLRNVTHRYLDTFSIGTVVAAQQVVQLTNPCGSSVITTCSGLYVVVCDCGLLYPMSST